VWDGDRVTVASPLVPVVSAELPETVAVGAATVRVARLARREPSEGALDADASDAVAVLRANPRSASRLDGDWWCISREPEMIAIACGALPELHVFVLVRGEGRRWSYHIESEAERLVACRNGMWASPWQLDPVQPVDSDTSHLHILVHERSGASGRAADGRINTADIYLDSSTALLRVYVTPLPGPQTRPNNPLTPAVVELGARLGDRVLYDGGSPFAPAQRWPPEDAVDTQR
jgi:hypothetical protein